MSIKANLQQAMKDAMRAKDKQRLGTIRLIQAEIQRVEVDERIEVDDAKALSILDKMLKQRRDSINQYEAANRQDLADAELAELPIIQSFLPAQLTAEEVSQLIDDAIALTGASSMKDMGKLMAVLRPQLQGRADTGEASKIVKQRLG